MSGISKEANGLVADIWPIEVGSIHRHKLPSGEPTQAPYFSVVDSVEGNVVKTRTCMIGREWDPHRNLTPAEFRRSHVDELRGDLAAVATSVPTKKAAGVFAKEAWLAVQVQGMSATPYRMALNYAEQFLAANAKVAALEAQVEAGRAIPEGMQSVEDVIAYFQNVLRRFGNSCVYTRKGGCSWGAVAMNRKSEDKKNGGDDSPEMILRTKTQEFAEYHERVGPIVLKHLQEKKRADDAEAKVAKLEDKAAEADKAWKWLRDEEATLRPHREDGDEEGSYSIWWNVTPRGNRWRSLSGHPLGSPKAALEEAYGRSAPQPESQKGGPDTSCDSCTIGPEGHEYDCPEAQE